ncbi:MAG: nucleoside phosphorylase [Proteobacteria bacterium]|nr:nucleoside phosphorylase [Pseudomonadota bacterium]MBU1687645.1 nucleoside phosphorylase [Pseudomonadota bacterium]
MTDGILINPQSEPGDPRLPSNGFFNILPSQARQADQWLSQLGGKPKFLFNSHLRLLTEKDSPNPFFVAGPAVGAPMAVMTLEKLIALGATKVIVYGWCGSLHPELKTGDILLPTTALSEEGTSSHYPGHGQDLGSSPKLREKLVNLLYREGWTPREGRIWTTDAPYRETRDKVNRYTAQGILAVDMEFSAITTVARFRNIELAAVMLVSDELWRTTWQPGYKNKNFIRKDKTLISLLLEHNPILFKNE